MKKLIVATGLLLSLVGNSLAATAPAAHYWEILGIQSSNGDRPYQWDDTPGNTFSTRFNHDGTVYAAIGVLGYSNPVATYNNSQMQLVKVDPVTDANNTIVGWVYYYMNSGPSGNVEIKDWSGSSYGVRDRVYVR